jgi:hypothetical protein
MNEKLQVPVRKVYQEPQLRVYGDVRILTGLINVGGAKVDGMFGSNKSQ